MSELRLADSLKSRLRRPLWLTLGGYAGLLALAFAGAGEVALTRSLEQSADVIESLLGLYADPGGERTTVAPEMLADQLHGMDRRFLITRSVSEGDGEGTIYFLTPDMPAQAVSPGAPPEDVRSQLMDAIAMRGRWSHRVYHRSTDGFDIYVMGSRRPYAVALAGVAGVALLLLPAALYLAHRATGRVVAETLEPLRRVESETASIDPADLGRRLTTPTGVAELTTLARTINDLMQRVERSHRELEAFTADASHELRTPLTHLRAQAQWALDDRRTPEQMREALEAVAREVEDTARMVEDLLLIARGENRQIDVEQDSFDLAPLVEEVEEIVRAMVGDRQCEVLSAVANGARALGDPARTRQILLNLASNAVRYTPQGTITLKVDRRDGEVGVSVRDTGIGIPAEHLERVFDRFYRVEASRARSHGGSGLGLTIARLLAELQGGRIEAESEPGTGSTFTLWLPEGDKPRGSTGTST